MYTPILKWRQGEYLALERLFESTKEHILPLAEIPPIEWDFENSRRAKTIDQHLQPFARRLHNKWKRRTAFVDLCLLDPNERLADGRHPVSYIFEATRENGAFAIPVTGLGRDPAYQQAVRNVALTDHNGVCLRLSFEDIARSDVSVRIEAMSDYLDTAIHNIDIVVDMGSPNFHPLSTFSNALHVALSKIEQSSWCRSLCIAASSFPETMGALHRGSQRLERSEWLLYKAFMAKAGGKYDHLRFGDYAIAHPVLPAQDMRLLRPSASLRYSINDAWFIVKGKNVRDYGFAQYVELCKEVVNSPYFAGENFSAGDAYILGCSEGRKSTGQLTVWRWVGTNHHLTKVVSDLANYPVP